MKFVNNNKGSVLIGLIITITAIASLSAGLIYIQTSSLQTSIFTNFYSRSYYLAESGSRYWRLTGKTGEFFLSNGDKFIITANTVTGVVQPNNRSESKSVIAYTSGFQR